MCNEYIHENQEVYALSIHTVQSSEYRGLEIANQIEEYMTLYGYEHINLIGHAQGGVCIRKAAKILKDRFGYPVVRALISIAAPHRGTPVTKTMLDENPDIDTFLEAVLGDVLHEEGNDAYASVTSMIYDDYDPHDGLVTGSRHYNNRYPVSPSIASHYASIICAQNDDLSPFVASFNTVIDGDGYCRNDCDNDGAAGQGDGDPDNRDDDGFVGINSQQMGYRLMYVEDLPFLNGLALTDYQTGYVGKINHPNEEQMTSSANVLNQDHFDVVGYGPDYFDELKFFAALFNYIAAVERISD